MEFQVKAKLISFVLLVMFVQAGAAGESDLAAEVAELRQLLGEVKAEYEGRISALEERLARAEAVAQSATRDAKEAFAVAEQAVIEQSSGASAANTFNPAIGAVLTGQLADVDGGWEQVPGFLPAGEIGTGDSGFALGEAEINMKAVIDTNFFGNLTVAVGSEDGEVEVGLEEAWLQTTGLPHGLTMKAGRFFSETGYLNKFHGHADDFADRPLAYQAMLGGQYVVDGAQLRWVVPAPLLVEFGAELDWGGSLPATANARTSPGSWTLFSQFGGDIGLSSSWSLGLSRVSTAAVDRESGGSEEAFSGDSDLASIDLVWKWAPEGNPTQRNVKIQAEYFHRTEDGAFGSLPYAGEQTGWYVQGVWQFLQRWRVGYRYDFVEADDQPLFDGSALDSMGRSAQRNSLMFDWSPSEFSRLRLQYARDSVLPTTTTQWVLQYLFSIGAHGAHEF